MRKTGACPYLTAPRHHQARGHLVTECLLSDSTAAPPPTSNTPANTSNTSRPPTLSSDLRASASSPRNSPALSTGASPRRPHPARPQRDRIPPRDDLRRTALSPLDGLRPARGR